MGRIRLGSLKNFRPIGKINDDLREKEYFDDGASGAEIFTPKKRRQIGWGILVAVFFFLVISYRLFSLQVQEGFINLRLAEGNRLRSLPIAAPRGKILDDKGESLVENEPVYQLVFETSKSKKIDELDPKIFGIIGLSQDDLKNVVKENQSGGEYTLIKDKISRDEALLLKSRLIDFGGFEIVSNYTRHYLEPNLCHILGYIGKISEDSARERPYLLSNVYDGKSGLENVYDEYLQGTPGTRRSEVDASGRMVRLLSVVDPQIGNTIQTSIDREMQNFVTEALQRKLDELKTHGVAIVMDPRDGSIKSMVSIPGYDNSKLALGVSKEEFKSLSSDPNLPLLNRAIQGEYPPGSSIKPFLATAALQDGVITPSTAFDTPFQIEVGQWKFVDWKDHGYTDVRRAIAESNNVFFYSVGGGWGPIKGLGPDGIKRGLEKFNFDNETGIDLNGEREGFIPTPEWKKKNRNESWYIGNTYNMSIGQGDILVTPLQLSNATATIANGGKLFKPHFIEKILDPTGALVKDFKDEDFLVKKEAFSSEPIQVVREGMRQTVVSGSASSLSSFPIPIAGKTGTAQFGNEGKTHAWFTSFAPYDNPELVVTILIEGGGEGYNVSAPLAREIYQWWLEHRK